MSNRKFGDAYDISLSQLRELVDEYIFSERDRAIIMRRWYDNLTIERLAEEFEMSPKQIQRIVLKCSEKIAKHIKGAV